MPRRLTHEEFVEKAKKINPTLKITGTYINSKTNIECQCLECGKKVFIQPGYITSNKGHICKSKIKPSKQCKSHEVFVKELFEKNPNIKVVSKYTKAIEKIDCECKICGHIWSQVAYAVLYNGYCPECEKTNSLKNKRESFISELSLVNPNVKIIGDYINNHTKLECECKICGNVWSTIPDCLLRGKRCLKCANTENGIKLRKTHEQYVSELVDKNICLRPLEKYIKSSVPIMHKCLKCGTKRKYTPNDVLRRKHCTICQGSDLVVQYGVNSLYDTNPEVVLMLADKELGKCYSYKSTKKVDFICPNCNTLVKNKRINYVTKHGLSCPKCSDGISYPMKFVMCLFNQLNVQYDTEVIFDGWTFDFNGYEYKPRYDIVFDKYIIEVDGEVHIKQHSKSKMPIEDIQYIDENKDNLAYQHGYQMIRINCYQSDMNYIKNNILQSELNNILDLSTIDWLECHKYAISSKVKEVCDYWNKLDNPSVTQVFTDLKMPRITVQRWLKQGALAGMCNYNAYEESMKNRRSTKIKNCKSVICLNTKKVYISVSEAGRSNNLSGSTITNACNGKSKHAGKDKNTGEWLRWMYYEDYLKSKEAI